MSITPPIGDNFHTLTSSLKLAVMAKRSSEISQPGKAEVEMVSAISQAGSGNEPAAIFGQGNIEFDHRRASHDEGLERITQQIREVVKEFQSKVTALQFRIDEESQNIVVQVVNKASGEVIRQIPPEEMLRISRRMDGLRGVLFDHQS